MTPTRPVFVSALVFVSFHLSLIGAAGAATLHVPAGFPTLQAAVDAASPHDHIHVAGGSYCGAVITKPVHLIGFDAPVIVGCDEGPSFGAAPPDGEGVLRVGFLLPGAPEGSPADGSSIVGFRFDGEGVSNQNLEPLTFGVFSFFTSEVSVVNNHFIGTIQSVTVVAGDRWTISRNRIEDLTLLTCDGICGGGGGIVVVNGVLAGAEDPTDPVNRPEDKWSPTT